MEQVSRRRENRPASSGTNIHTLDQDDVTNLLQGSQLGSRLQRQVRDANSDEDSDESFDTDDGDNDSDADSDYIANDSDVNDIYFNSDESSDLEDELEDILADAQELQPADQGTTFLEDLLQRLRWNKSGKINWLVLDVNDLVNNYLRKPMQCMKLVHDELNIISDLIQTYTGVKVFRMSDTKPVKINKLITNFRTSSQQLVTTTCKKYKVQTLQYWAQVKLMDPLYPKIYLQIVVTNAIFETNARQWLQSSTVPMTVNVPQDEYGEWHLSHECHSYPEWNEDRKQFEFRCIDPGHTLANMRSQISRYGYEFCSKAAFVHVSETNHDVMPKSILKECLDRQSIRIAKRFFSVEVQQELQQNGDLKEANFVRLIRNWFNACDERGIDAYSRIRHLNKFADYLAELIEWEEMPPPINYIKEMPVPTYEALMQGITTHLQIFSLTDMPINQRALSTVGIESFFSDLTHMEFSRLGCPKAVDIPQLITHVTELNSIKHDLQCRFSFNTLKQGAYPYDTLLPPTDPNQSRFNLPHPCKQRKTSTILALPKAITRGQLTIREFHHKDEGKIHLDKCAGIPTTFNPLDPS